MESNIRLVVDPKYKWPRLRDLPVDQRGPFEKWLYGQTVPHVTGVSDEEQDFFYPWDFETWYNRARRGLSYEWD